MTDRTSDAWERRLVDLETRLAYHERMAEEMSDLIAAQGRMIDLLKTSLNRLDNLVVDLEQGFGRSPQDDKPPPHY